MIALVTYTDEKMTRSAELCVRSSEKNGVDKAFCFEFGKEDASFLYFNRDTFEQERGAGYWLWKPYCIWKTIEALSENDILIYSDAGVEFIAPVQEIISRMDEDIFFFTNGWPHHEWCKGDVMYSINWQNQDYGDGFGESYKKIKQIQASVIFFRVNQRTRDFVKEWLLWCQMPGFIDDTPNTNTMGYNSSTFAEHRHDQAILTCLAIKHGYTMDHWWPTQYSYHLDRSERDSYPVLFNHHRKRDNEY